MKKSIFHITLLLSVSAFGQVKEPPDTIRINEVVIRSGFRQGSTSGFRTLQIDTLLVKMNVTENLGELLSGSTTLYIKSYGPGGISTPSFRGTSASHTQISWNGLNISNPMLGQTDLSVIPAGISDQVNIYFGANPGQVFTPGIGGTISLEDKPDWRNGSNVSLSANAGSFGRYSTIFRALTGNAGFQSATRIYANNFQNDFPYLNKYIGQDPVELHRTNSSAGMKGVVQEIFLKRRSLSLSGKVWYQSAKRNLPQPVIALSDYGESQTDESLRAMIDMVSVRNRNEFYITSGYVYNNLNYVNIQTGTDSRNATNNLILRAGTNFKPLPLTHIRIFLENDLGSVNSNNYNGLKRRNIASFNLNFNGTAGKFLSYSVMIREKADGSELLIPDFSFGSDFRLFRSRDHFINASFSRNSRLPSLNELFWNPGGNPDLKDENAFIYEVGYKFSQELGRSLLFSSETELYHNNITDMIQWHPGPSSFWIPENLKNIQSTGVESNLKISWSLGSARIESDLAYAYTRSVQVNPVTEDYIGKQLIYVPANTFSTHLTCILGDLYSVVQYSYTGTRFISQDNTSWLPGYSVLNFTTGYKLSIPSGGINFNLKIENLLGTYYETVAFYPQPGRSFSFSITYEYSNRQKIK